jgi:hypothetical protein
MKNRIFEIVDFENNDKNFKMDFKKASSKIGKVFIETIQSMWVANGDIQTEEEFCEMNGIPKGFFENKIKKNNPFFDIMLL